MKGRCRAGGGRVMTGSDKAAKIGVKGAHATGENPNVLKLAGKGAKMTGSLSRLRLDRPARKKGGRVNAGSASGNDKGKPIYDGNGGKKGDPGKKVYDGPAEDAKEGPETGKKDKEDKDEGEPPGYAAGGWIKGAINPKHKGLLHKDLHVPLGEKIPAAKLAKAARSSNPALARRANLAKTLGKLGH